MNKARVVFVSVVQFLLKEKKKRKPSITQDYALLYNLMCDWKRASLSGKRISVLLTEKGYNTIAVYGMGVLGKLVCEELLNEGFRNVFGVDRNPGTICASVKTVRINDIECMPDVIIITVVQNSEKIRSDLRKKTTCPILLFNELIDEL